MNRELVNLPPEPTAAGTDAGRNSGGKRYVGACDRKGVGGGNVVAGRHELGTFPPFPV
jgi:hypothetical protein